MVVVDAALRAQEVLEVAAGEADGIAGGDGVLDVLAHDADDDRAGVVHSRTARVAVARVLGGVEREVQRDALGARLGVGNEGDVVKVGDLGAAVERAAAVAVGHGHAVVVQRALRGGGHGEGHVVEGDIGVVVVVLAAVTAGLRDLVHEVGEVGVLELDGLTGNTVVVDVVVLLVNGDGAAVGDVCRVRIGGGAGVGHHMEHALAVDKIVVIEVVGAGAGMGRVVDLGRPVGRGGRGVLSDNIVAGVAAGDLNGVPSEFEFYFGPNDFQILKNTEKESTFGKDLEFQKLVYLGWPIIRWINRFFTLYVFDWLSNVFPMGIVLILITLLLKLITYPMVKKSYMSSAKMRVLKPKLEAATAQFNKPEDQMQKQQAMMAEYAKYGVSPLSGCLPMLIQMPVWVAMFNFVPNAIQLRGEKFLWMNDLSTFDPIFEWNTNIWLIGDHLSLTCILFCVANLLYSWMTMRQQRDQMVGQQAEQMKMMQWMMYLMPLMFFFMFNDYSAGLNFYYFISLFFSAAIMWTLRKTTNDEKLLAILEKRYQENKSNPKKASGLMARMQALQELQRQQQEEMQRKQAELNEKKNNLGK